MGPHEVVNGANGSVTWCQGPPFCPECSPANPMPRGTVHVLPMAGHCQGCRCHPVMHWFGDDAMPPWGYRIIG